MNAIKSIADKRITGILWLALRLFIGYEWLTAGIEKFQSAAWIGDKAPAGISGFLNGAIAKAGGEHPAVYDWYANFLRDFALPNATLFSYMVVFGEILVGAALIIGVFSKWAAFWGATMNLAFLLAGSTSSNGYMLTMEVAMVFGGLGVSFYGLDTIVLPYLRKFIGTNITHTMPKGTGTPLPMPIRA